MKRLLIIDFFAVFHRGRAAMKRTGKSFSTSSGAPVTGVFPFINNLLSTVKLVEPTHVVVCYDAGGNKRKQDSDTYKANRAPVSDDFKTEAAIVLDEALYSLGVEVVGMRGYEADDIIHTIHHASNFGMSQMDETIIWTCDQDLLQCVTERTKVLLFNSAKKQVLMGVDDVIEKWGCYPDDIKFVKAISGDASDNIHGVPRVGPKTALKILNDAQWLMEIVFDHPKLKGYDQQIKDNLELVTLRRVYEIEGVINFDDYELGKGMASDYSKFLSKYELTSLQKRLGKTTELMMLK